MKDEYFEKVELPNYFDEINQDFFSNNEDSHPSKESREQLESFENPSYEDETKIPADSTKKDIENNISDVDNANNQDPNSDEAENAIIKKEFALLQKLIVLCFILFIMIPIIFKCIISNTNENTKLDLNSEISIQDKNLTPIDNSLAYFDIENLDNYKKKEIIAYVSTETSKKEAVYEITLPSHYKIYSIDSHLFAQTGEKNEILEYYAMLDLVIEIKDSHGNITTKHAQMNTPLYKNNIAHIYLDTIETYISVYTYMNMNTIMNDLEEQDTPEPYHSSNNSSQNIYKNYILYSCKTLEQETIVTIYSESSPRYSDPVTVYYEDGKWYSKYVDQKYLEILDDDTIEKLTELTGL